MRILMEKSWHQHILPLCCPQRTIPSSTVKIDRIWSVPECPSIPSPPSRLQNSPKRVGRKIDLLGVGAGFVVHDVVEVGAMTDFLTSRRTSCGRHRGKRAEE